MKKIEFQEKINKVLPLFPLGSIAKKITASFIILLSSIFLYVCGYLFLWGYYLGGKKDHSLISIAINYVPINKYAVSTIGAFYLLIIIFVICLILVFFKEKLKEAILFIILALFFVNLSIALFLFGTVNLKLFINSLAFWIFPLLLIINIWYYYIYIKFTKYSILISIIYFVFFINVLVTWFYLNLSYYELIPYALLAFYFFSIPLIVILFIKLILPSMKRIRMFIFLLCIVALNPTLYLLIVSYINNIFGSVIIDIIITILCFNSLMYLFNKYNKVTVKRALNSPIKQEPMIYTHPRTFITFLISILLVSFAFIPSSLIKGGEYLRDLGGELTYDDISYIRKNNEVKIKGTILTKENDTYYIVTPKKDLMIISSKDIIINRK